MSRSVSLAFSALLMSGFVVRPVTAQPTPPRPAALVRARVLDVRTGSLSPERTIVVRDGRIASIGTEPTPPGLAVIDLRGKVVVPGLIDAHAHIADPRGARAALLTGVTTIRSAGVALFADVALRDLVRSGRLPGPDVLAAGVHIQPHFENDADVLSDPRFFEFIDGVRGLDAIRRATAVDLDHGVDVIKTSATDRAGLSATDPRRFLFDESQLRALVETAAARRVPVMAHAHGDEGAANAVRAGVRSIEHGTYLSEATLGLMKAKGVWFVPTYSAVVDIADAGGDYDEPGLQIRGRHMLPRLREAIRDAVRIGVAFATGVDTDYGAKNVRTIAGEVAHLVDAGVTPLVALQAATTSGARLLGIDAVTGVVEPGFEADLIVVDGNPLEHVARLQDPLLIMSNGHVVVDHLDPSAGR
ncbi:MAG: amidohydrolase family protein [Vicinamibacterales bacterium]